MRAKHFKEGLADMANKVELDHEVQMAVSYTHLTLPTSDLV